MLCVDAYCLDLNKLAIEDKAVFESPPWPGRAFVSCIHDLIIRQSVYYPAVDEEAI